MSRRDYQREQSNVGLGMVPCRAGCRCSDCTIEKLQQRERELEAEVGRLTYERDMLRQENALLCGYESYEEMQADEARRALEGKGDE